MGEAVASIAVPIALPTLEDLKQIARQVIEERVSAEVNRRWLTNKQAAEYLGVSPNSWARIKKAWGLPSVKHESMLWYDVDDINRVMDAHLSTPGATVIAFPSIERRNRQHSGAA